MKGRFIPFTERTVITNFTLNQEQKTSIVALQNNATVITLYIFP